MHYYTDVLKKYTVFKGRATRKEYWMFFLFNVLIVILLSIIGSIILKATGSKTMGKLLSQIYSLAVLIPSIAVTIRRFHDIGKTGWWVLYFDLMYLTTVLLAAILVLPTLVLGVFGISFYFVLLVFLAITAWSIIWRCKDSQLGDNKYGPNPKEIITTTTNPNPETPTQNI